MKTLMKRFALLAAVGLCAGCAVLKVEVDVYKGPLLNDERVQVEQVAATAIAAKPSLIRLRDHLAWGERLPKSYPSWYRRAFIPPMADGRSWFISQDATTVNGVLSLFESFPCDASGGSVETARRALDDYARAIEVFRPDEPEEARESWEGIVAQMRDADENTDTSPGEVKARRRLRRGYERLLTDNRYDPDYPADYAIFGTYPVRRSGGEEHPGTSIHGETLEDLALRLGESLPTDDMDIEGALPLLGGNFFYTALQDRTLVEAHADVLFPDHSDLAKRRKVAFAKDAFVARVTLAAKSFMDARAALVQLWRSTLLSIEMAGQPSCPEVMKSEEAKRARAAVVSNLTSRERLLVVLLVESAEGTGNKAVEQLRQELTDQLPPGMLPTLATQSIRTPRKGTQSVLTDRALEVIGDALREAMLNEPLATAEGLLAADAALTSDEFGEAVTRYLEGSHSRAGIALVRQCACSLQRRFGLVHGPTVFPEADTSENVAKLSREMGQTCPGYGGGLEGGRLDKGIEELSREYLAAVNELGEEHPLTESRRDRLFDELVHFAQKLLYIGGDPAALERHDNSEALLREFAALQAAGNSILVHTNWLRAQARHKEGLKRRHKLQSAGTAAQDAEDGDSMPEDAREASTAQIDRLHADYVNVVAAKGTQSPEAKRLRQAIAAEKENRANMAYIGLTAEYLRSSTPVPTAQQTQEGGWHNMLMAQWRRAFFRADWTWPRTRDRIEFNDRLDKQYWQNINTVRVAGWGRTNYAVVKDDIGNWYVKGYDADVDKIMESAKNLALYAMGPTAALSELSKELKEAVDKAKPQTTEGSEEQPEEESTEAAPAASPTAGKSVLDAEKKKYEARTDADHKALKKVITSGRLRTQIEDGWKARSDVESSESVLMTALSSSWQDIVGKGGSKLIKACELKASEGEKILALLEGVLKFHRTLETRITSLGAEEAIKGVAIEVARKETRAVLVDFVERRKAAVSEYEAAIALVGKATRLSESEEEE